MLLNGESVNWNSKNDSLQILRGLAAWMIFFHHYMQIFYRFKYESDLGLFFTQYASLGIDVFFVLSGFVMYLSVRKNNNSGVEFFLKRFFRVAPLYWFYTLLIAICIFFIPEIKILTDYNAETLFASLFFIPIENPSPYLLAFPLLSVGWTLNFEMMFYLILSISIMLSRKWGLIICFAIILVFPVCYPSNILFSEVLTSTLLYEFISGFVVAFLIEKSYLISFFRQPMIRLFLVASTLILSIYCLSVFEIHIFFVKLLGAGLMVFSAALFDMYLNKDNKLVKFLVSLGDFSYSTYLAHTFVLMFYMHYVGSWISPINDIIILSVTLYFMSKYSYRLIEKNAYIDRVKWLLLGVIK